MIENVTSLSTMENTMGTVIPIFVLVSIFIVLVVVGEFVTGRYGTSKDIPDAPNTDDSHSTKTSENQHTKTQDNLKGKTHD